MDSDSTNNENDIFSRKYLFLLRKQKIQKEIEAARRLIKNNADILEIADKFIHNTFELMKDGIFNRNPDLTEVEIHQQIKDNILFKEKLKTIRKKYIHNG